MTATGVVQSHTVIRVPDKAHTGQAPFVLLLVKRDDGSCVLGHFDKPEPPAIGTRVRAAPNGGATIVFFEDKS